MKLTPALKLKLIGIVSLLAFLYLGFNFVVSPRLAQASDIDAQRETVTQANLVAEQKLQHLTRQVNALPAEREYLKTLVARFPLTAAQPLLFQQIRAAGDAAGIPERSISTVSLTLPLPAGAPVKDGSLALAGVLNVQGMSLRVEGTHLQVIQFLRNLEMMPRSYLISSIGIGLTGPPTVDAYSLKITGSMFVLSAPVDPQSAAPVKK